MGVWELKEGAIWSRAPEVHPVDATQVLLVDRGLSLNEDGVPAVHEKAVLMRLEAGRWRIAGEAPLAAAACLGVKPGDAAPSAEVGACARKVRSCASACPCSVASNGCEMCKSSCGDDAAACLGIPLE